jgi:hypothetical protein
LRLAVAGLGLVLWVATAGEVVPVKLALEMAELEVPIETAGLQFSSPSGSAMREPDFAGHRIARSALGFGPNTNEHFAFAWDQTAHRLYLDANRNRDLTDDPVYVGTYEAFNERFAGVRLGAVNRGDPRSYLLDIRLGGQATNDLKGNYLLRSYWQTRIEVEGRAWQLGVAQMPSAASNAAPRYLVLRRWEARNEPMVLNPGTPHLVDYTRQVFFGGKAYGLECRFGGSGSNSGYVLELTPQTPALGEVQLTGRDVYRLVLQQTNGFTAVLDDPRSREKIPVGLYTQHETWVRRGGGEAFLIGPRRLFVSADHPVDLTAGGPIANTVTARRSGEALVFSYQLLGADGQPYRLTRQDTAQPPLWTVYQGERRIDSGKFESG